MNESSCSLTVLFEDPFWIGVFEETCEGELRVCKVTFGSEPKDYEVKEFLLQHYFTLNFSPSVDVGVKVKANKNPKRAIRDAAKQTKQTGIGTKSQQALKLLQEENKYRRKVRSKEQKEAEEERKYLLRQEKRREKHKGR